MANLQLVYFVLFIYPPTKTNPLYFQYLPVDCLFERNLRYVFSFIEYFFYFIFIKVYIYIYIVYLLVCMYMYIACAVFAHKNSSKV